MEKLFLDIGCGSGLFSLAARNLGAVVHSFDYDLQSVGCAEFLKSKYHPHDRDWRIEQGSVLDKTYIEKLGKFNIVYSWGVLHHTGHMWQALSHVIIPVQQGGQLFIAIYNDQGWLSKAWWWVKRIYCSSSLGKLLMIALFFPYFFPGMLAKSILTGKNGFEVSKLVSTHSWGNNQFVFKNK